MNLDVFSTDAERVESFGSSKITALDRKIVVGIVVEFREKVVGLNRMDSQVGVEASMWAQTNIHSRFQRPLDKEAEN